jgi:hypothetical protein
MYYLVSVDHNSVAVNLTRNDVKGFKKCCISSGMKGTDVDILWNGIVDEGIECVDGNSDIDWYRQRECDILCVLSVSY